MHIGTFKVPELRLAKLIPDLRKIFETYGDGIISSPTRNMDLAKILDYEGGSGPYHKKLTALKLYCLLEGHGKVRISSLGKRILTTEGMEFSEAYRVAALSIPLWNEIYKKFNTFKLSEVQQENVRTGLMEITGCNKEEVEAHQASITKDYDEDVSPIRAIGSKLVIHIRAGKNQQTWPFTERARKRAISWLNNAELSE